MGEAWSDWRDIAGGGMHAHLAKTVKTRFHYEIIKSEGRLWSLFYRDNLLKSKDDNNRLIGEFEDPTAAKRFAKHHMDIQANNLEFGDSEE